MFLYNHFYTSFCQFHSSTNHILFFIFVLFYNRLLYPQLAFRAPDEE